MDHEPFLCLSAFKNVLNKRFRWIHYMESSETRLRYLPGTQNVVAGFISRNNINHTKLVTNKKILLWLKGMTLNLSK